MGKYDETVYRILSDPVTPNEVAKRLGVTQKTTKGFDAFNSHKGRREIQELRPNPHFLEGERRLRVYL